MRIGTWPAQKDVAVTKSLATRSLDRTRSLPQTVFAGLLLAAMAAAGLPSSLVFAQEPTPDKQGAGQTVEDAKPSTARGSRKKAKKSKEAKEELYVRVSKEDGQPKALETAIVRFVGAPGSQFEGRTVDLVGVVHIGQLEYYRDLNARLAKYDAVLYELVAPDGTRIRPEDLENRRSVLASMQSGMKDMLNLEYQLEHIDYMAKNFRHADMSPEEFMEDMQSRGDGLWKMAARMMGAGLATQASTGGDAGMLMALLSTDRSKKLKQVMAKQLTEVEAVTAGMDDENGENTLIKGRNRKAFEVLRKELDAGKKNVAVFYGAGHLSDMAVRLQRDFGMKPTETLWLAAWDLQKN